jgi:MFS family permease
MFVESKTLFIILSLAARILQGLSSVGISVTVYSIGGNFYPDQREFMIGMLEAAAGFGMMIGPLFGTILYAVGGYGFIYYSFGSVSYILAIGMCFLLPRSLDKYTSQEENFSKDIFDQENQETIPQITIISMFKDPNYTIVSLIGSLSYF